MITTYHRNVLYLTLLLGIVFFVPLFSSAENGVADPRIEPKVEAAQPEPTSDGAGVDPAEPVLAEPHPGEPPVTEPSSPSSVPEPSSASSPALPPTQNLVDAAPATISEAEEAPASDNTAPNNMLWWVVIAIVAVLPFGFFIVQALNKKSSKEDEGDKCFDIKNLLDKKLKELTDLKGVAKGMAEEKARDAIRDLAKVKPAGDVLVKLEQVEKEYQRLKKMYEECTIEFAATPFKGTLIENSLLNKEILKKLNIEKTYQSGEWTLHRVRVSEKQMKELSEELADGPWYVHFWEQGKDEVRVVFKGRVFTIQYSDRSTWSEAVAYGLSLGIPKEQLDFPIE